MSKKQYGFILLVWVLTSWLLADMLFGQHPATCIVRAATGKGSGSYIGHYDGKAVIITAHHVVEKKGVVVDATFPTKNLTVQATVAHTSGLAVDTAVLFANFQNGLIPPMKLADTPPKPGDRLHYEGFSARGYHHGWGTMREQRGLDLLCEGYITLSGQSGGPVRNEQGELVSLISGYGGDVGEEPGYSFGPGTRYYWAEIKRGLGMPVKAWKVFNQCTGGACQPYPRPGPQPWFNNPLCPGGLRPRPAPPEPTPATPQPAPGPAGPPGPPGPGVDMDVIAAQAAAIVAQAVMRSLPELAEKIQPHLDPIYPQWVDANGKVVDEFRNPDGSLRGVKLGETMPLRVNLRVRGETVPLRINPVPAK